MSSTSPIHFLCKDKFLFPSIVAVGSCAMWSIQAYLVKRARDKHNVKAPSVNGDPEFESTLISYQHTSEALPAVITSSYLFSIFICPRAALGLGLGWIACRLVTLCPCCGKCEESTKENCKKIHNCLTHATHFSLILGAAYGIGNAIVKRGNSKLPCC